MVKPSCGRAGKTTIRELEVISIHLWSEQDIGAVQSDNITKVMVVVSRLYSYNTSNCSGSSTACDLPSPSPSLNATRTASAIFVPTAVPVASSSTSAAPEAVDLRALGEHLTATSAARSYSVVPSASVATFSKFTNYCYSSEDQSITHQCSLDPTQNPVHQVAPLFLPRCAIPGIKRFLSGLLHSFVLARNCIRTFGDIVESGIILVCCDPHSFLFYCAFLLQRFAMVAVL